MIPDLLARRDAIAALCARFHVRRLDVVGSAARGADFDPTRSDADFLVEFDAAHTPPTLSDYLALRAALAGTLGRDVDLIMESAVRNPFVLASLQQARETVYAA